MTHNNIMVNGKKLDEYLKSNTSIEEQIEREKLFQENTETIRIGRHIKEKFKPYKERNGRVKILSTAIVNEHNYENKLKQALTNNDWYDALIICLIACPDRKAFYTEQLAEILTRFCKKHNIGFRGSINHKLRPKIGKLRKSKLVEHMFIHARNTPENPGNVIRYGIRSESREQLTIDQALDLSKIVMDEFKEGNKILNPDRSKRVEKSIASIPKPPVKVPERPADPKPPNLIDDVIRQLKSIQDPLFKVQGDLHIHIYIER